MCPGHALATQANVSSEKDSSVNETTRYVHVGKQRRKNDENFANKRESKLFGEKIARSGAYSREKWKNNVWYGFGQQVFHDDQCRFYRPRNPRKLKIVVIYCSYCNVIEKFRILYFAGNIALYLKDSFTLQIRKDCFYFNHLDSRVDPRSSSNSVPFLIGENFAAWNSN